MPLNAQSFDGTENMRANFRPQTSSVPTTVTSGEDARAGDPTEGAGMANPRANYEAAASQIPAGGKTGQSGMPGLAHFKEALP